MYPVDVKKYPVTLAYGVKTKLASAGIHKGVDFGCPVGTPVRAVVSGTVTGLHWGSAFGLALIVDNDRFNDGSAGLWIVYAHLSKTKVKVGDKVIQGQIIGSSGKSGHVTGPHLHIEVQKTAQWNAFRSVNPKKWLLA